MQLRHRLLALIQLRLSGLDALVALGQLGVHLGGVLLLIGAAVLVQLIAGPQVLFVPQLGRRVVQRQIRRLHRRKVFRHNQAAHQHGHVQKRVLGFLQHVVPLVLGVNLLLFGHGLIGLFLFFRLFCGGEHVRLVLFQLAHRLEGVTRRHVQKVAAVIHGAAVGLLIQLQNRAAQGGLAAAGFAHQTEDLALVNIQGDAIVGLYGKAALQGEILLQIGNSEQRLCIFVIHLRSSFRG